MNHKYTPNVAIIISTYNGEDFINEQLNSLCSQDYPHISIYIRDDLSKDNTLSIIKDNFLEKITFINNNGENLGPALSFLNALVNIDSDIYMFCDQDDIWNTDKVSRAVQSICKYGLNKSILYHSNLALVDANSQSLNINFEQNQGQSFPRDHCFERLLIENSVVGCTTAFTKALVKSSQINKLLDDGRDIRMHDWWLALTASIYGKIIYDPVSTIKYRQHQSNVCGVSKKQSFLLKLINDFRRKKILRFISHQKSISLQSKVFGDIHEKKLTKEQLKKIAVVNNFSDNTIFNSFLFFKHRFYFRKLYLNLLVIYLSLFNWFYKN
ncbi:MAG: glycosyltransferase family 2 protein [Colwellia sp.]